MKLSIIVNYEDQDVSLAASLSNVPGSHDYVDDVVMKSLLGALVGTWVPTDTNPAHAQKLYRFCARIRKMLTLSRLDAEFTSSNTPVE